MIFWAVLVIPIALLAAWWGISCRQEGPPGHFLPLISLFLLGIAAITCVCAAGCEKAAVQGSILSVEQLRQSASTVDLQASEDVFGKVTDFNQMLAEMKWQNEQWWGDPFIPDEWMAVAPIPIKQAR